MIEDYEDCLVGQAVCLIVSIMVVVVMMCICII